MKTAHELAKELLAGPDLPIYTPRVAAYDDTAEDLPAPVVTKTDGETWDGKPCTLLVISYSENDKSTCEGKTK